MIVKSKFFMAVKVVVSEKESGIKLMRSAGFFLLFFSGMETAMKYCLLSPSRINCSIEIYQPHVLARYFPLCCYVAIVVKHNSGYFLVFTRAMQKGVY